MFLWDFQAYNLDLVIMGSHKEAHDEPLVDLIESLTVES